MRREFIDEVPGREVVRVLVVTVPAVTLSTVGVPNVQLSTIPDLPKLP